MSEELKDYLVVITNYLGGGSWARGKDRADTIKRAANFYKRDWKDYFPKIGKKGTPVTVNVIDVTGLDTVEWDDRGFWVPDPETKKLNPLDRKVDVEQYVY
jgi:hypothetical protein